MRTAIVLLGTVLLTATPSIAQETSVNDIDWEQVVEDFLENLDSFPSDSHEQTKQPSIDKHESSTHLTESRKHYQGRLHG